MQQAGGNDGGRLVPAGEVKLSLHFAARAIARHERVQLALAERHSTAHLKKGGGRMAAAAGGAKQEEICKLDQLKHKHNETKTVFKSILDMLRKGIVFFLLSSQTYANEKLYEGIGERLSQMKEVAAYKFRNGIQIQSIEREETRWTRTGDRRVWPAAQHRCTECSRPCAA